MIRVLMIASAAALFMNSSLYAADKPVKVFVLAGQSNMVGSGFIAADQAFNDEYEKNMANFIRDIRKDLGLIWIYTLS